MTRDRLHFLSPMEARRGYGPPFCDAGTGLGQRSKSGGPFDPPRSRPAMRSGGE